MRRFMSWLGRNFHITVAVVFPVAGLAFVAAVKPPDWMISLASTAKNVAHSASQVAPWANALDEEWRTASLRSGVFQLEIKKAEERALGRVDEYFAQRALAADRFIKEMTGNYAKFSAATSILEIASSEFCYQLGLGRSNDADTLIVDTTKVFRRHVLTSQRLSGEMQSIADGFIAELNSLETRFRDEMLPPGSAFDPAVAPRVDATETRHIDAGIATIAGIVRADFTLFAATTAASWIISEKLGNAVASPRDGFWDRQAIGFMAGFAVDTALDKALASSGYDPVAKMRGATWRALKLTRDEIVEGPNGLRMSFVRLREARRAALQQTINRFIPGAPAEEITRSNLPNN